MTASPRDTLLRDARGATIVEFAMVAPVLLLVIMGLLDLGYNAYTASVLQGAIQRAARQSTLQGADLRAERIDENVRAAVRNIVPSARVIFSRSSYASFSDVSRAEDFIDANDSGSCDDGESFEDANGNDRWDRDRGKSGTGGARDAVLYNVRVEYPRLLPVAGVIGVPATVVAESSSVLRNQPWDLQRNEAPRTGQCP